MIENFVFVSSAEQACRRFQLKLGEQNVPLKSPCLVSGTDLAWVIAPGSRTLCRVDNNYK